MLVLLTSFLPADLTPIVVLDYRRFPFAFRRARKRRRSGVVCLPESSSVSREFVSAAIMPAEGTDADAKYDVARQERDQQPTSGHCFRNSLSSKQVFLFSLTKLFRFYVDFSFGDQNVATVLIEDDLCIFGTSTDSCESESTGCLIYTETSFTRSAYHAANCGTSELRRCEALQCKSECQEHLAGKVSRNLIDVHPNKRALCAFGPLTIEIKSF